MKLPVRGCNKLITDFFPNFATVVLAFRFYSLSKKKKNATYFLKLVKQQQISVICKQHIRERYRIITSYYAIDLI